MSNTNQLIEEKDVLDRFKEVQTGLGIDKVIGNKLANFILYEVMSARKKALSQTEQECDKKWREKIESKKKSEDKWSKRNNSQVLWTDIGYNQALDDLLKQ